MKRFVKDSIEHELVFSEEFSEAERDKLQRFVQVFVTVDLKIIPPKL